MSDVIHLLPDSVANQIAAGEVIQRPASVVKELIENSIDAGATHIQVLIKDAGRTSIQVVDNGKGMSPTDARLAFERHATSKITSAKDLFNLSTMGFRGEALASIAAVAQVELKTRLKDSEFGTLIELEGTLTKQEAISCSVGTSFIVKNLFFNVPARRKFLKSNNTELRHIIETFQRIALTYPEIAFSLSHNNSDIYQLQPTNRRQRIVQVFGKRMNQQLLAIEAKTNLINISGFVGNTDSAGKNVPQFFFVNGRYMRHPYFHKAVLEAYSRLLKQEQMPSYFIYFDINPMNIDINVHPTKTEIKFQDERDIWQILMVCIKESLGKFNIVPSIDFDTEGIIDFPSKPTEIVPNHFEISRDNFYNPFNSNLKKTRTPADDWETLYNVPTKDKVSDFVSNIQEESDKSTTLFENQIDNCNEFWQYKNQFILTSVKSGLMIIHQRRAHTQILYEQFLAQNTMQEALQQRLLFPEKLELDATETITLLNIEPQLKALGFDISNLGQNTFAVNGIPTSMTANSRSIIEIVKDLIACAYEQEKVNSHLNETLAFTLAKSISIPTKKSLTQTEINDLIDKLFQCSNHQFLFDGKPIMTIIADNDIEKKFL